MNQVALVGNLTDDPELRYTQSGAGLAGFTVAVSHRSKHNGQCGTSTTGSSAARHGERSPRTRAARSRRACGSSWPASSSSAAGRTTTATSVRPSRSRSPTWDRTFSSPLQR
jgi:Single-strand binding protein family